jgi:hypothetical protein
MADALLKGPAGIQYLVIPDADNPYLLARVRWPDVAQAISAGRPYWQDDPGLFDLPYDPVGTSVSPARAAAIAASWGANFHSDPAASMPSVIRRMPANWSELVPAERRAFSLEFMAGRRAQLGGQSRWRSLFRVPGRGRELPAVELSEEPAALHGVAANGSANGAGGDLLDAHRERMSEPFGERRRHARVRVDGRAHISRGHRIISANLVNVSQGGVHCVVAANNSLPKPGGRLDPPLLLEHELSKSSIILDVASSVTWHKDNGPAVQLGVVFAELNNEQAELVHGFLVTVGAERAL